MNRKVITRFGFNTMPDVTQPPCERCDGMGMYPVFHIAPGVREVGRLRGARVALTADEVKAWEKAHVRCSLWGRVKAICNLSVMWRYGVAANLTEATRACDGWHFIKCQACNGNGRRVS